MERKGSSKDGECASLLLSAVGRGYGEKRALVNSCRAALEREASLEGEVGGSEGRKRRREGLPGEKREGRPGDQSLKGDSVEEGGCELRLGSSGRSAEPLCMAVGRQSRLSTVVADY